MKKLNQIGNTLLYVLLGILAVVVLAGAGWFVYSNQAPKTPKSTTAKVTIDPNDPFVKQYGANCPDVARVKLANTPVATDQIRYIEPMGKMDAEHVLPTDHAYIWPLNPDAAENSYGVVMPADGRVVAVKMDAKGNHRVVLALSCRYYAIIDGIRKLDTKLTTEAPKIEMDKELSISVPLNAGDPLGQVGGTAISWSIIDVAKTNPAIFDTKTYASEPWRVHVLDPIGSFKSDLGAKLTAKSLRSTTPTGGKIDFDRKLTLQGNWFRIGSKKYDGADMAHMIDGHMSVVPDSIDQTATIVSLGNWQGKPAQFIARGDISPFQANKANSPVKYELLPLTYDTPDSKTWVPKTDGFVKGLVASQRGAVVGTILVQVQDNDTIKVELFPGKKGVEVTNFTAAAVTYER